VYNGQVGAAPPASPDSPICASWGKRGLAVSRASRRCTGVVVLAVAALLTACSGSSSGTSRPSSSTKSTTPNTVSPSNDATARAETAVLAAYSGYWAAQVEAGAHPNRRIPEALSRYSIDKAQADAQATIVLLREQGIVVRGKPLLAPVITALSLGNKPYAAITDCVDSTHWKPVYRKTGKSALAPGQKHRVVMDSTAEIYAGRWVIRTIVAHRDRTC
jgi:hypothetical protein